jgi:hypothetical protein
LAVGRREGKKTHSIINSPSERKVKVRRERERIQANLTIDTAQGVSPRCSNLFLDP